MYKAQIQSKELLERLGYNHDEIVYVAIDFIVVEPRFKYTHFIVRVSHNINDLYREDTNPTMIWAGEDELGPITEL